MSTTTDQRDELAKALKEAIKLLEGSLKHHHRSKYAVIKYNELIEKFIGEWKVK